MVTNIEKYKAIANECRLRLLYIILTADTSLCICKMMDALEKERYQISRFLSVLKEAELVMEERDGRLQFYHADNGSAFNRTLFQNIRLLDDETNAHYADELKRLHERLSKRENGKLTVTYGNS